MTLSFAVALQYTAEQPLGVNGKKSREGEAGLCAEGAQPKLNEDCSFILPWRAIGKVWQCRPVLLQKYRIMLPVIVSVWSLTFLFFFTYFLHPNLLVGGQITLLRSMRDKLHPLLEARLAFGSYAFLGNMLTTSLWVFWDLNFLWDPHLYFSFLVQFHWCWCKWGQRMILSESSCCMIGTDNRQGWSVGLEKGQVSSSSMKYYNGRFSTRALTWTLLAYPLYNLIFAVKMALGCWF